MKNETITIKGARENNLKNICVQIPKYKLVALTGVSGSGKSSFAMDILQKECQRQYLESMGMITDGLNKPKVDSIEGLSPSIAIGQRVLSNNPRSTVGTYTEILTYLRILYAQLGIRTCFECGNKIPLNFDDSEESDLNKKEISCPYCGVKLKPLSMASFSFNKTEGACSKCNGTGKIITADYSKIVDENKSIAEGAFYMWSSDMFAKHYVEVFKRCAQHYGFDFDTDKKVKDYNEIEKIVFYKGVDSDEFKELFSTIKKPKRVADGYVEGVETFIEKKLLEMHSKKIKNPVLMNAVVEDVCTKCNGTRLSKTARTVTLCERTITDVSKDTIEELMQFISIVENSLSSQGKEVAHTILVDLKKRLNSVIKIGLEYLSIDRPVSTLSGGETQRLRLTNVMDSGLTGVLYVLDEPTTGLHPKDTAMLLKAIKKLRDLGNTIIVIEHDMDFVSECDYIIDFGPFAGRDGGEIVAFGTPKEIMRLKKGETAKYIGVTKRNLNKIIKQSTHFIEITKAKARNLKNISVKIPLGQFVCFTGVSGSGKSSLVFDVLAEYIKKKTAPCESITGLKEIKDFVVIDQKPIGRQSRSNIATYTDVFTFVRELYASLPEAKNQKLKPADFSFNVQGGRCEKCQGLGVIPLDMQFLEDVEVICPTCKGKRFKKPVLAVKYKGKSISDILNSTIDENTEFFIEKKEILHRLKTLQDVGLGYLKLGQSTTTLSGGECQRVKLSKELVKQNQGNVLYVLDEPTTGLHPSDIDKLLELLQKLIAQNNSVFVIEHALEVIAQSDHVIDLGVDGGIKGGYLVAQGTPYEVAQNKASYTGKYLSKGELNP